MEEIKVIQKAGEISFNINEIKAEVEAKAKEYDGAVYTESSVKLAKKDLAELRKYKTDLDTARKQVKKNWLKPYEEFEKSIKEVIAIIDKPIFLIDTQVKDYEIKRVERKKEAIKQAYDELIGEAREYLPLNKIYDSRWENATFTISSINDAIKTFSENTITDVETIKSMNSEAVEKALNTYKSTLSLKSAIDCINAYEIQKQEILKHEQERKEREEREKIAREKAEQERIARETIRKKIEDEERARAEEQQRLDKAFINNETEEEIQTLPFSEEEAFESEQKKQKTINLYVTDSQFDVFKELMFTNDIDWSDIDDRN